MKCGSQIRAGVLFGSSSSSPQKHATCPVSRRNAVGIEYYPVKNWVITAGEEGAVKIWAIPPPPKEDKQLGYTGASGWSQLGRGIQSRPPLF